MSGLLDALRRGDWVTTTRIRVYACMLLALTVAALAGLWATGEGRLDAWGRPLGTDYAALYGAGRMALAGKGEVLYDYAAQYREQRALFGGPDDQPFYAWFYPPVFLLLTAPLALLPYLASLAVWLAATFAFYLAAIRFVLPSRLALLAAAGFPGVFVTLSHGQNAFLTTGLLAFGLGLLERAPWLAGLCLGALCYKPHLGLVVPVILVASGNWRAFAGAAGAAAALALASLAFGIEAWTGFIASAGTTTTVMLDDLSIGWFKMQTLFAAARGLRLPAGVAYALQGLLTAAIVAALAWTWRRRCNPSAKAAACVAALIATPFSADYDLTVLAAAIAFLVADGLARGFLPYEKSLLALVWFVPLFARPTAQHLGIPLGFLATATLFAFALLAAERRGRGAAAERRWETVPA